MTLLGRGGLKGELSQAAHVSSALRSGLTHTMSHGASSHHREGEGICTRGRSSDSVQASRSSATPSTGENLALT